MKNPDSKVALITGATSGIGAEFARRLGRDGYDLILTGRREREIETVAAEIRRDCGVEVRILLVELGDNSALDALVDVVRTTPTLEFLVNNAGFALRGWFNTQSVEQCENMLDVHARATIRLTHAALPGMLARRSGAIVNVSSLASFIPYPGNAMYSATKAFVTNFSESLHLELRGTGVRVQALCPGLTQTDFHTRMGLDARAVYAGRGPSRALLPREVVDASFAYLAKDRVICLPGFVNRLRGIGAARLPRSWVYRAVLALFARDGR